VSLGSKQSISALSSKRKPKQANYLVLLTARLPCPFFGGPFPRRLSISSLVRRLHRERYGVIKIDLSQHTPKHQINLHTRISFVYDWYEWYHSIRNNEWGGEKWRTIIRWSLVTYFTRKGNHHFVSGHGFCSCRWSHHCYANSSDINTTSTGYKHAKMVNQIRLGKHDKSGNFSWNLVSSNIAHKISCLL
jgi:hypothetical protein